MAAGVPGWVLFWDGLTECSGRDAGWGGKTAKARPSSPRVPTPGHISWSLTGPGRGGGRSALGLRAVWNLLRCGASWSVCLIRRGRRGCDLFLPVANARRQGRAPAQVAGLALPPLSHSRVWW